MSEKKRNLLIHPIYLVVDDNTVLLPSAKVQVVKESELPETGEYYAVGCNGTFFHKDQELVKACTKVPSIAKLGRVEPHAQMRLPKLPPLIIRRALAFFQRVWDVHRSEAEVMLLYNSSKNQYDLWCPNQTVSGGGVNYELSEAMAEVTTANPEWRPVGTIHSHCNFSAYHSGVDEDDEDRGNSDGLHITLGHVDRAPECSVACSTVINGHRWRMEPEEVILGVERTSGQYAKRQQWIGMHNDTFFVAMLPEKQESRLEREFSQQIQQEWLPLVTKQTYAATAWKWQDDDDDDDDLDTGEGRHVLHNGDWVWMTNEELDIYGYDQEADDDYLEPSEAEKDAAIAASAVDLEDLDENEETQD